MDRNLQKRRKSLAFQFAETRTLERVYAKVLSCVRTLVSRFPYLWSFPYNLYLPP